MWNEILMCDYIYNRVIDKCFYVVIVFEVDLFRFFGFEYSIILFRV